VTRGESDAFDTRRSDGAQDLCESRRTVEIATVAVHILAKEGHLENALRPQLHHLVDDRIHGSGAFAPADVRHDAVRAEVVAPHRDGNPGMPRVLTLSRKLRGEVRGRFQNLNLRSTFTEGTVEQGGQMCDVVSAEHHIDVRNLTKEQLAVALAYATADSNELTRPTRLYALERLDLTTKTLVCVLTNTAGHEYDDVSILSQLDGAQPLLVQQTGHALGVVLVHLAPEGANQVGVHSVRQCSTGMRRLRWRSKWQIALLCMDSGFEKLTKVGVRIVQFAKVRVRRVRTVIIGATGLQQAQVIRERDERSALLHGVIHVVRLHTPQTECDQRTDEVFGARDARMSHHGDATGLSDELNRLLRVQMGLGSIERLPAPYEALKGV